jgi:superfamily II DNA or RNA helicase
MDERKKLKKALEECARLQAENLRLRSLLRLSDNAEIITPVVNDESSPREKIALFRSLFHGRQDVYAIRWVAGNGRSGYSPACANEWDSALCGKPKTKCADCPNRKFLPLTDQVLVDHLSGKHTIGIYPLLTDETCRFLVVDFDRDTWIEDAEAYLGVCEELEIHAALERSRSGQGGHVWIFFRSPISAEIARKLGFSILTRAMEKRYKIAFDSYDRFFPSQDTMPKGGFGNLIALPPQRNMRDEGNTVFLDKKLKPFQDQWSFLSSVEKVQAVAVQAIVCDTQNSGSITPIRMSRQEVVAEDPWTAPSSGRSVDPIITGLFPESVRVVMANMIFLEKTGLPSPLLTRIKRLASFRNPEFYRAQAMRLSTFGKPQIISCAEDLERYMVLPRGTLDELLELLKVQGIAVKMEDERFYGTPVEVDFVGELRTEQKKAAEQLLKEDIGILSAATAFGKTVVAAWMIAERRVNTLVLVHRKQLMDQWRDRLNIFIDFRSTDRKGKKSLIGLIGGGKDTRSGLIDIGMLQSLNRKGEVKDLVAEYGQIIVDECHHISAFSFEQVLKKAKPRYVLGLTATPVRKDGHHPIIVMQCGPIRYRVDARKEARKRPFEHVVIPRYTNFRLPEHNVDAGIQDIYRALPEDDKRNYFIFDDILKSLETGRTPLVLTERAGHVDALAERLSGFAKNIIILKGGMNARKRKELAEQLETIPDGDERVIIATGRFIGEGFDDHRLDTLFLAMPISWRGTLHQYAGRLHRIHDNKQEVQIYDYVDIDVPVLKRMFEKRLKGYRAIGYVVRTDATITSS